MKIINKIKEKALEICLIPIILFIGLALILDMRSSIDKTNLKKEGNLGLALILTIIWIVLLLWLVENG